MPLKVNIGLSRKVGESNYGSRGASVNVEMELDGSLVSEPEKLKDRIRQLFGLVRTSLAEELNGNGGHAAVQDGGQRQPRGQGSGNGHSNGGGRSTGQRTGNPRPATQSQVKAIYAIARNQRLDLAAYLNEQHGVNRPEDLDIKTASQVIDALKAESQEGRCA
jgi:hypothetical protein